MTWWCWAWGPVASTPRRSSREAGLDVVGVDEALVGGECPFWGCTPSKLMVRPADLLAEVHRADRLAGAASVTPDWSLVAARIREANHDWTDSQHVEPLEEAGVTIVRGHGRLDGPGVVRVEKDGATTVLRARRGVLLNTGTAPLRLPIDGLDAHAVLDQPRGHEGDRGPRAARRRSAAGPTGWSWPRSSPGTARR